MAIELQRNRELTRTLYTLRGEAPPNEHGYVRRRSKDRFLLCFLPALLFAFFLYMFLHLAHFTSCDFSLLRAATTTP